MAAEGGPHIIANNTKFILTLLNVHLAFEELKYLPRKWEHSDYLSDYSPATRVRTGKPV